jgi:hypothetical protein
MKLVELQPTTGPLPRNPAMGWAIYIDQDGTTLLEDGRGSLLEPDAFWKRMAPALRFANQLYIRLPWSEFEPEQGRYAWEHNPRFLGERYQLPIVITENGMSGHDWLTEDGAVHDPR